MIKKLAPWPQQGELVLATITALNPNSAFANLDEYDKRAMIPVSEVATTWVKDIRKWLRVGQKVVALVRQVDVSRGIVHLSLKRVKPTERKQKLAEVENERKAEKLLEIVAKELSKAEQMPEVIKAMQQRFGLVYSGFEAAAEKGAAVLTAAGVPSDWATAIEREAKKAIKPREVVIKAELELKCLKPDGIHVIKRALATAAQPGVEIKYISAPRYSLAVRGADYPTCEKVLAAVSERIISAVKAGGGEAQLIRKR